MSKSGGFSMKRTVCAVATATLSASGLFVGVAQAADSGLFYGDIEQSKRGTLTIHKFESGSLTGQASAGNDDATGDGVDGVTFKLYKIDVDLTKPEGWRTINGTTVPAAACNAQGEANFGAFTSPTLTSGGQTKEGTTSGGGVARIADLEVGAYLVCEQPSGNVTNKAQNQVSVLKMAAPFIVTVPRPHQNGQGNNTAWIYDVHAYPKNTVVEAPRKATNIRANGIKVTDGVEYTITTKVPSLLNDQHFKYFSMFDQLPELTSNAKVVSVTVDNETMDVGNQYTVSHDAGKDFIAVDFTLTGLSHLKTKRNTDVVVTIHATVDSISRTNVANTGYFAVDTDTNPPITNPPTPVTPQGPGKPPTVTPGNPPIKESNKTATTWGDLKIRKHDAAQQTSGLQGAKFQVFAPADQSACVQVAGGSGFGKYNQAAAPTATTGNAIAVGAETTFTTNVSGELVIEGLFVGKDDAAPGGVANPAQSVCYVVQETEAPAGYVLPALEERTFAVIVKAGTSADADLTMANTKISVPELPLTGASGRVLLMIAGLTLVLGSMGVVMLLRKRNAEA